MKKFISWRRVSTKRQGMSGLGLSAQADIIDYFVKSEKGELIADFEEVYTGTELSGCVELKKAIKMCKETDATLIIAKSDRFRSTIEALQILEEVGENRIMFCDLPHTDKFTLTLFFAIAEREALLISLRTKAALKAKKERGELTGGACRKDLPDLTNASKASAQSRREKARMNPANKAFWEFISDYQMIHGRITANTNFQPIADELNKRGKVTSSGLCFDKKRARAMYVSLKNIYFDNYTTHQMTLNEFRQLLKENTLGYTKEEIEAKRNRIDKLSDIEVDRYFTMLKNESIKTKLSLDYIVANRINEFENIYEL